MQKWYVTCAWVAVAGALSGCGGSGGIASAPPAPVAPPTIPPPSTTTSAEVFNTPEYEFSTSAKYSNAIAAWQAGATGQGVKIGFVDSGITADNPEFAGRIDPASRDIAGSGSLRDDYGHGTALASIAAAAHDNSYLEGVAPEATIVMMKVAGSNCTNGCSYNGSDIASGIDRAAAAGAKVINLSIGGDADSAVVDAVRNAARSGVIFIVSAGNESSVGPTDFARSIANAADGRAIIVGALGNPTGGDIDYYRGTGIDYNQQWSGSNGAGSFGAWFLMAPGFGVRVAYQSAGVDVVQGTSFAAPAVAGAAALLLQAFPNLTPQEIVQILLTTADDLGQAGIDSIYGRGRLNIGHAFQPIGQTVLAGAAKSPVSTVDNGSAPAAVGDALQRGSLQAIVLDAYQRAYSINLARTLKTPSGQRPLAMALGASPNNVSLSAGPVNLTALMYSGTRGQSGFRSPDIGPNGGAPRVGDVALITRFGRGSSLGLSFSSGATSLVRKLNGSGPRSFFVNQDVLSNFSFNGRSARSVAFRQRTGRLAISGSYENGDISRSYNGDQEARYRLSSLGIETAFARLKLGLRLSRLDEKNTVLGGRLGTVFGTPGARTSFLDLDIRDDLGGGWSVAGEARRGWTDFAGGRFKTGSYSFGLDKAGVWRSDDYLSILLSQPLRVDSGGFALNLPGSYDYGTGAASYGLTQMRLTPKGREGIAELAYSRPWRFGSAGFNIYGRRQPGHFADAAPDIGGALQIKLKLR